MDPNYLPAALAEVLRRGDLQQLREEGMGLIKAGFCPISSLRIQALRGTGMRGGFFVWLFIGLAVACLLGYWVGYDVFDWLLTPGKLMDLVRR